MNNEKMVDLLMEALETEKGGVEIYETAVQCAVNAELKKEWGEYLEQTRKHVTVLEGVCDRLGFDIDLEKPNCQVVRHIGKSLVQAMEMARENGTPEQAELVAAECVVLAETKDHSNWELIGLLSQKAKGDQKKALKEAYEEVEVEEDEHLYHTKGWARELHIQAMDMKAVLPPPEEEKEVTTAIGAARVEKERKKKL